MNPALLSLKYKDLPHLEELSERQLIDLGWKIRKRYLVHATDESEKAKLRAFADCATDGKLSGLQEQASANVARLNAQRWRYDKDSFKLEPPHEESWERVASLYMAAQAEPEIAGAFIRDFLPQQAYPNFIADWRVFARAVLLQIWGAVDARGLHDLKSEVFTSEFPIFLLELKRRGICVAFLEMLPNGATEADIIEDLGLEKNFGWESVQVPEHSEKATQKSLVTFEAMDLTRLISITWSGNLMHAKVNSSNLFVRQLLELDEGRKIVENFAVAYAKANNYRSGATERLHDFNCYLALQLNREFGNED